MDTNITYKGYIKSHIKNKISNRQADNFGAISSGNLSERTKDCIGTFNCLVIKSPAYTFHCWAQTSSETVRDWTAVPTRVKCLLITPHNFELLDRCTKLRGFFPRFFPHRKAHTNYHVNLDYEHRLKSSYVRLIKLIRCIKRADKCSARRGEFRQNNPILIQRLRRRLVIYSGHRVPPPLPKRCNTTITSYKWHLQMYRFLKFSKRLKLYFLNIPINVFNPVGCRV